MWHRQWLNLQSYTHMNLYTLRLYNASAMQTRIFAALALWRRRWYFLWQASSKLAMWASSAARHWYIQTELSSSAARLILTIADNTKTSTASSINRHHRCLLLSPVYPLWTCAWTQLRSVRPCYNLRTYSRHVFLHVGQSARHSKKSWRSVLKYSLTN